MKRTVIKKPTSRRALRTPNSALRAAFTLVEMLVAVGLVVLMMSLFATIFQLSTSALATQKGIAENDQRARLALTLLRRDIENRTAKIVQPFEANENTTSNADIGLRDGYFYIGENDRNDNTDDVLQLTVKTTTTDLFYGRSVLLTGNIATDPNQPEFDDGFAMPNNAGSSQYAEVSYFLRNGTLYRRVLLIRQPIKEDTTNPGDGTPKAGSDGKSGGTIPLPQYQQGGGTENFLTDFDYSAYATGSGASFTGPFFHGVADLSNANDGATNVFRLGNPKFRFGHDNTTGLPREFIGNNFIGRFTHWETSYKRSGGTAMTGAFDTFGFPGRYDASTAPSPMNASLVYNQTYGLVSNYSLRDANGRPIPGPRAAEDILLTRVVRFDVKIWDDKADVGPDGVAGAAVADAGPDGVNGTSDDVPANGTLGWPGSDDGKFVDVGHNGATGDYAESAADPLYMGAATDRYMRTHPANSSQRIWRFDTWNPTVSLVPPAAPDPPPFHAPDDPRSADPTVRLPLRAIQIRLTFYDLTSQQLRDATLVVSLTNRTETTEN